MQDEYFPVEAFDKEEKGHPASFPLAASWKIKAWRPETGEIIHEEESPNIVVKVGRDDMLRLLFNLSGSSLVACAVGSGTTAATVDDTRLTYEYLNNGSRKSLTNTSGAALSAGDIGDEETTISGCTFYKKITAQAKLLTTDLIVGPVQEYGLFTTEVLPSTPTGTQATMFNHYVAASAIQKDSSIELIIQTTVRT